MRRPVAFVVVIVTVLLAIVFGLSMDYEVFLRPRMGRGQPACLRVVGASPADAVLTVPQLISTLLK
jgi:hypothetical protein